MEVVKNVKHVKHMKNLGVVVTCSHQPELCRNSRSSMGLSEVSLNRFLLVFLSILKGCPVLGNDKPLMLWIIAFAVRCNRKILRQLNFIWDRSESPGMMRCVPCTLCTFKHDFKCHGLILNTATSPVIWGCVHLCNRGFLFVCLFPKRFSHYRSH